MTQEQKAKAYDEALERAREYWETDNDNTLDIKAKGTMEYLFPVLKESEAEKIRKELIEKVKETPACIGFNDKNAVLAWLEKVGEKDKEILILKDNIESLHAAIKAVKETNKIKLEKPQGKTALETIKEEKVDNRNYVKPADKVEPKFKVGDWIIRSSEGFKHNTYLVTEVKDYYVCEDLKGRRVTFTFNDVHKNFKLWHISDAKDGDVLCGYPEADYPWIGIFYKVNANGTFNSYCYLQAGELGKFCPPSGENIFGKRNIDNHSSEDIVPATKEQRDTLFAKMREAGYDWDANKKELKHIEQKPMLSDFLNAEYERGKADALQSIEWSEEDESMYTRTLGILGKCYIGELPTKVEEELNWFKTLKERIGR